MREGGEGQRRFLAETQFGGGEFADVVYNFKNKLAIEFTGKSIFSPMRVVQFCSKYGRGTVKSILIDRELRRRANWKPRSVDKWM